MNRPHPRVSHRLLLSALLLSAGFQPFASHAQTGLAIDSRGGFGAGAAYETYRFGSPEAANIESLSLVSLPFHVRTSILARTSVEVRGAFARGELVEADGTSTSVAGLVDTEVNIGFGFLAGSTSATINAIMIAPTGDERLDRNESRVVGLIASELLPFRFTNWGMGGAAGVSANVARPFGAGSVGLSLGYLAAREFEPASDVQGFTYRPGDRLQVRLAADRNLANSAKLSLSVGFERHQEDRLSGTNLYRAGNRYQLMSSYALTVGTRSTAMIYGGALRSDEGVPLQTGAYSNLDFSTRTLFLAGGGLRMPLGSAVAMPSVDLRLFRRGSGSGQGYLAGFGASLELPSGSLAISPSARVRLGNYIVRDGTESGITGVDIGLTVRAAR